MTNLIWLKAVLVLVHWLGLHLLVQLRPILQFFVHHQRRKPHHHYLKMILHLQLKQTNVCSGSVCWKYMCMYILKVLTYLLHSHLEPDPGPILHEPLPEQWTLLVLSFQQEELLLLPLLQPSPFCLQNKKMDHVFWFIIVNKNI